LPSWLTYSGWFTHISGHPSAAGQAQDSESTPAKDRCSTAGPRNQLVLKKLNLTQQQHAFTHNTVYTKIQQHKNKHN